MFAMFLFFIYFDSLKLLRHRLAARGLLHDLTSVLPLGLHLVSEPNPMRPE